MNASTAVSQRRRKRMRTQTRSTPWKDSFELDAVGQSLLLAAKLLSSQGVMTPTLLSESEQSDLYNALFRVNMWKARSDQGRIPHSMETTFALAQVAWRDATDANVSSIELRMAYSTAILRGVNGLADALQQNRAYAASVASLCEQRGLPGWLVDIRHEAAHNDLPSLSVLRLATKTFLGYLQERYWEPLTNARSGARETAVQLLVKYKETCKKNATGTDSDKKEEAADDDAASAASNSSSDESEMDDDNDDNIWGQSLGTSQNRFSAFLDASKPKPKKKRKKEMPKSDGEKQAQNAVHSALHFARAFVRDTPIDVGYQVALSLLVWGGIGDAPSGRGVLIPGSPASFPASEEGIQRIRHRYSPLLRVLCKSWPGFMHALLVHLVDHVILIETLSAENELDAGSERKLYFLDSWIRLLLSRRFHMHNDNTVARFGKQDLSKKVPANWTKAEHDFMESVAPCSVLLQAGLPLNYLCDRCLGSGKPNVANGIHGLGIMLSDILGDNRVSNHAVAITNEARTSQPEPSGDSVKAKATGSLSLDEMEMMLDGGTIGTAVERTKASPSSLKKETANTSSTGVKSAWSHCQTWDSCAIGSLPGRPV